MIRGPLAVLVAATTFGAAGAAATPPPENGNKFPLPPLDDGAAEATGTLAVRAVQGTPGGPAIGPEHVELQLIHRGVLVDRRTAQLDEHGVVMFEDLRVGMGVLPVVSIDHAGVTYQRTGALLDADRPQERLDVTCYEVTSDEPAWHVPMRHVIVSPDPEGVRVTEVLVIDNPGNRTWLGAADAAGGAGGVGEGAPPATMRLRLPENATDVDLGQGFHDGCCTTIAGGELINHLPLMPETTELGFSYLVPAVADTVVLDVAAPADTGRMIVMVPDEMRTEATLGLEAGRTQVAGETRVRSYMRNAMRAGEQVSITLTGLSGEAAVGAAAATDAEEGLGSPARTIAAIGGGLILLVAVAIIFARAPKRAAPGTP